jgi:transcriptional regulator with XRE-family HTH domain
VKLTIGQCVLLARHKAGLTHKEIGERVWPHLAAPHVKIKKIEHDKVVPTDEELLRLAQELGTTVGNLKGVETEPSEDTRAYLTEEGLSLLPELQYIFKIINHAGNLPRDHFVYSALKSVLGGLLKIVDDRIKELKTDLEEEESPNETVNSKKATK